MFQVKNIGLAVLFSSTLVYSAHVFANDYDDHARYCQEKGGVVESMPAQYLVPGRYVNGASKDFCNFYGENYFASVGLETFSSDKPSIAATYIKRLGEIGIDSPLWKGEFSNPGTNVCKNLGGASITFITSGGFVNHLGQAGVCVFGDASMVSEWTLVYIANHREGYDAIKEGVNAEPLNIRVPS
ncbi:hypothetical protein [Legionella impletisoli]|uniref:Uncharacterized protein n=1 Tax=Legionella impletisoli TaxID=343510 RepID=A0A917JW01_9GAMM|nr:hypothetical protein [Legionella impletisoli]GGI89665.1 hypothetical protein GCM10007966_17990 [Legionella impletisoli]